MNIKVVSLKELTKLINQLGKKADFVNVESEKYPGQLARALLLNNEALLTEECVQFLNTKYNNAGDLRCR